MASTFAQSEATDVKPNTDEPDNSDDEKRCAMKFDASLFLEPDPNLGFDSLVELSISSEKERIPEVCIQGDPDCIESLVFGKNMSLETDRFTVGSSDSNPCSQ